MVGSTARAERLDPEDVRAILTPYHERVRHELERHGGTVEKFIGDAVVAVFGAPVAHEDDPERAVRAGLAIQEAIAELNEGDPALALEVRVGVATGEALVSVDARPEVGESMVAGDVMNVGARLQSAAPPGGVLVGEHTYRATDRAIEYAEHAPIEAKGKAEPLSVWLAIARRASFGIDLGGGKRAPLVGRDDELDVLARALSRARAQLEPQLVTLVGVPGIGKSRLVQELFQLVEEIPDLIIWRQGRSLPYGEGVALWALGEMVKAQSGILESDDVDVASAKLSAAIRDLVPDETETRWIERHLRPLVGIREGPAATDVSIEEAFAAWRRFLEALAESGPCVLVFEDLHWSDEALLDFVDSLDERVTGVPLLVVCSARPELLERRPGWGGGKRNASTISLAPLSDEDTARLLGALLEQSVLPASTQAELLRRAGGIPLFAEEYARMQQEGSGESDVPETLQGVVAARIDGLPSEEKALLQAASVLGKVFWTDALVSLVGNEPWQLDEPLHALERKEFVRRERRSAVAGARQLTFVHALVRDAAYGQVPRAERARLHRRVAEWIESLPPDRSEDRSEMLASHLVRAIEYGEAAGAATDDLRPAAVSALGEAGERAASLHAYAAAARYFEQAIELVPEGEQPDPHLLFHYGYIRQSLGDPTADVLLQAATMLVAAGERDAAAQCEYTLGQIAWQAGDHMTAWVHYDRAIELVRGQRATPATAFVLSHLARACMVAGRNDEATEYGEQALALAEELGLEDLRGATLNNVGVARVNKGDRSGLELIERSLAVGLERGSIEAVRAYLNLGSSLQMLGDQWKAADLRELGLERARQLGTGGYERWLECERAQDLYFAGRWAEAWDAAAALLSAEHPVSYMNISLNEVRSWILLARGKVAGALDELQLAVDRARVIFEPQALLRTLAGAARIHALARRTEEAAAFVDELERTRTATSRSHIDWWPFYLAAALDTLGQSDEFEERIADAAASRWLDTARSFASADFVDAADILAEIGSLPDEALTRLRAAEALAAEGREAEAREQLDRAAAFFREVEATAWLAQAEALASSLRAAAS